MQFLLTATGIGFDITVEMFRQVFPDDYLLINVPVVLFGSVRRSVPVLVVFVGTAASAVGQPRFFVGCPHFCTMAYREISTGAHKSARARVRL
jgi:hypothetical protein